MGLLAIWIYEIYFFIRTASLTWILNNWRHFLLWWNFIYFTWCWNQFNPLWLKLIFYKSIIWSFWSLSYLTFIFHVFVNRIMRRNRTIFIVPTIQKFLRILKIIRSYKHWLFNKSSIFFDIFLMVSKFVGIDLPTYNLLFSISFLSEFFYQLSFIFL